MILEISGRLDSFTVIQIRDELDSLINAGKFEYILDMSNVSYVGSSALDLLMKSQEKVHQFKGDLKLVYPKVLGAMRAHEKLLTQFFRIYPNMEKALERTQKKHPNNPVTALSKYECSSLAERITHEMIQSIIKKIESYEKDIENEIHILLCEEKKRFKP